MTTRLRPILGQVFLVTIAAPAILLGVLLWLFVRGSRESIFGECRTEDALSVEARLSRTK